MIIISLLLISAWFFLLIYLAGRVNNKLFSRNMSWSIIGKIFVATLLSVGGFLFILLYLSAESGSPFTVFKGILFFLGASACIISLIIALRQRINMGHFTGEWLREHLPRATRVFALAVLATLLCLMGFALFRILRDLPLLFRH